MFLSSHLQASCHLIEFLLEQNQHAPGFPCVHCDVFGMEMPDTTGSLRTFARVVRFDDVSGSDD